VDRLVESTGRQRSDFCLGCLTGNYPATPVEALPNADRQPALKL
jgi:glutamine phosphoribosylpyrophosphate amidotransferase